jgi:hypothetical protein
MLMRFGTPLKSIEARAAGYHKIFRATVNLYSPRPGISIEPGGKKFKCGFVVVQEDVSQLTYNLVIVMIEAPA